jgi:chaperonin GroEL (HSP60 family)
MSAYARALRALPATICDNAGLDRCVNVVKSNSPSSCVVINSQYSLNKGVRDPSGFLSMSVYMYVCFL